MLLFFGMFASPCLLVGEKKGGKDGQAGGKLVGTPKRAGGQAEIRPACVCCWLAGPARTYG